MSTHAIASPSSAEKWLNCANSLAAELGQPDTAGGAAALGTAKHELLAHCLLEGCRAESYLAVNEFQVDEAFAADVQNVVDNVRARIQNYENLGYRVEMDLEQAVPIGHITGEEGATGTADIVLRVYHDVLPAFFDVIDAKFGYGEVQADDNPQLKMYALGVIEKHSLTDEFDYCNLVIAQPARSRELIEGEPINSEVLAAWGSEVAGPAAWLALKIRDENRLHPDYYSVTEKGCQWCKAAAVCPARIKHVEEAIGVDFETIAEDAPDANLIPEDSLGEKFAALEVIEDWIKAVRARVEAVLLAGKQVSGIKLVAGKKGNRQWSSEEEAEALMRKFALKQDQMYSKKLLGPKPILDLLKDQPRRFKQIEALVVQHNGKPHVALDSDKRSALEIKPAEDGFSTID